MRRAEREALAEREAEAAQIASDVSAILTEAGWTQSTNKQTGEAVSFLVGSPKSFVINGRLGPVEHSGAGGADCHHTDPVALARYLVAIGQREAAALEALLQPSSLRTDISNERPADSLGGGDRDVRPDDSSGDRPLPPQPEQADEGGGVEDSDLVRELRAEIDVLRKRPPEIRTVEVEKIVHVEVPAAEVEEPPAAEPYTPDFTLIPDALAKYAESEENAAEFRARLKKLWQRFGIEDGKNFPGGEPLSGEEKISMREIDILLNSDEGRNAGLLKWLYADEMTD